MLYRILILYHRTALQVMARCLRYVCQLYGCHLVYLGGLGGSPPGNPEEAKTYKEALDGYARLMSHLVFTGMDPKARFLSIFFNSLYNCGCYCQSSSCALRHLPLLTKHRSIPSGRCNVTPPCGSLQVPLRLPARTDHLGALFVPAGSDTFRDIGRPRGGAGGGDAASGLTDWQALFAQIFPPKAKEAKSAFAVGEEYRRVGVHWIHTGCVVCGRWPC